MSRTYFAAPQRMLHWLMAACIVTMLFVGIYMISTVAPSYVGLVSFHKALGLTILALAIVRLVLRFVYGSPPLPADMPALMRFAAVSSQYALYACMLGMPLIGATMVYASTSPALYTLLHRAHFMLGLGFFALVLLHLSAALFHKLVRKDGVFESMARLRG